MWTWVLAPPYSNGVALSKLFTSMSFSFSSAKQKEQKEHFKGEVEQAKRGTGARMKRYRVFKTGLLHFYLGRCGLTVLIDSCKLITTGSAAFWSHQTPLHIYAVLYPLPKTTLSLGTVLVPIFSHQAAHLQSHMVRLISCPPLLSWSFIAL